MKLSYPWFALGLGLLFGLLLVRFGAMNPGAEHSLPLLTLLLGSEFSGLLTAIAAGICVNKILQHGFDSLTAILFSGNLLLAAGFLWLGLRLWPYANGSIQ